MLFSIALALLVASASAAGTCPPQGFDSVKDLNQQNFLEGPWYIQEQVSAGCKPSKVQQQTVLEETTAVGLTNCSLLGLNCADDHCLSA